MSVSLEFYEMLIDEKFGDYICINNHNFTFFTVLWNYETRKYHCPVCKSSEWELLMKEKPYLNEAWSIDMKMEKENVES